MARTALRTEDVKIDQAPPITEAADREGQVVRGDESILKDKEYAERLAMGEEPVTIEITPSTEENAPTWYPAWVNGRGAEMLMNGKWRTVTFLPVGGPITTKRKYVEVLARAKTDNIKTKHDEANVAMPQNTVTRTTSAVANFVVLEDSNPRGVEWLRELRRRNH
jgi:hypothetical protein